MPFVAAVNIGPSRTGWLARRDRALTNPTSFRPDLTGGGWKGCVMARAYPWDTDDTPPSAHPFTSFFYATSATDNNWPSINDDYKGANAARKGPESRVRPRRSRRSPRRRPRSRPGSTR